MTTPPLAITMGDASGVGPEILLRAFASGELGTDVVAVGDLAVLDLCNRRLQCDVTLEPLTAPRPAKPGILGVLDEGALSEQTLRIGEIDRASGAAALAYVARATKLALAGDAAAVVTLPINKAATRLSAPTFTGHTEYVAELCGRTSSTLMLASERAIVTHVSTHVSLREAIALAQPARILEVIVQTDEILRRLRPTRRIAVAGLNPHAGEGRAFGDEDDTCIAPAIARAREQGLQVSGPHPPDTVFLDMVQGRIDAVVCMYHDQGHIPMKLLDFRGGVNVTLGLPIVRTSVDHGTAFDIAWKGVAFTDSLRDACAMARRLSRAVAAPRATASPSAVWHERPAADQRLQHRAPARLPVALLLGGAVVVVRFDHRDQLLRALHLVEGGPDPDRRRDRVDEAERHDRRRRDPRREVDDVEVARRLHDLRDSASQFG